MDEAVKYLDPNFLNLMVAKEQKYVKFVVQTTDLNVQMSPYFYPLPRHLVRNTLLIINLLRFNGELPLLSFFCKYDLCEKFYNQKRDLFKVESISVEMNSSEENKS